MFLGTIMYYFSYKWFFSIMKAPEKFQLSMKINATINEFIFRIVFDVWGNLSCKQ